MIYFEHLYFFRWFDFQEISNDSMGLIFWLSLNNQISVWYRGRKYNAKTRFTSLQEHVEATMDRPPAGIDPQRWSSTGSHFLTSKQKNNDLVKKKECWKKQVVKNPLTR